MNLLLFGPPGSGKGTQSARLVKKYSMKQISTGDLFRNAIRNKTSLGLQAKGFIDKGLLVPDELVTGIVEDSLSIHFSDKEPLGLILDGYPRTLEQAVVLGRLFDRLNKKIGRAIFINLDTEVIVERLVSRRVCRLCNTVYSVKELSDSSAGVCVKCNGEIIQRSDDKEDVIRARLEIYYRSAKLLIEFYDKLGLYREVDGLGTAEVVFGRIEDCIV